ncbi:MAG: phosphatase PAP2 family protein [Saprospiraceae bacterium]
MKSILKNNRIFFISVLLLAVAGGIYMFDYEKPALIYFLSQHRSNFNNLFFTYLTKLGEGYVYIVAVLFFLTYKLRHSLLIALIGFFVMGFSFALKSYFSIDRPLAFLQKNNLLDQVTLVPNVELHSGASSFPSGHTMSAFAIYSFLILVLPSKKRIIFPLLLIALGVALSRVYLVQHFFVDVYVGGMIGVMVAVFFYWLQERWKMDENHFLERPLKNSFRKNRLATKQ